MLSGNQEITKKNIENEKPTEKRNSDGQQEQEQQQQQDSNIKRKQPDIVSLNSNKNYLSHIIDWNQSDHRR